MPVVSYACVSENPPVVVVGCSPKSFTYELSTKSRAFSLCVLDRRRSSAIAELAVKSGREVTDKLKEAGIEHNEGARLSVPVIVGAEATLECKVTEKKRVGDHDVLFGQVKACYSSGNFDGFWDFRKYRPVLYTGWREGMTTYGGS